MPAPLGSSKRDKKISIPASGELGKELVMPRKGLYVIDSRFTLKLPMICLTALLLGIS